MCPMRFNRFPMDEHTCKFKVCVLWLTIAILFLTNAVTQVGSTNFNDERMVFGQETLSFDQEQSNTILDYQVIRDGGEQDLRQKRLTTITTVVF